MSLSFSALHFIIGNESPNAALLRTVINGNEDKFVVDDTHYLISTENIEDQFFWISAKYGKFLPYSPTVYNTEVQTEEDNPRTTEQIETDKQLFALYSVANQTLYVSNSKKGTFLEKYFKSKFDQDVTIKAFFKNVDEFISQIKTIEKIKFVAKSNLFSSQGGLMQIFPSPNDLYGLGMPEDFSLEANFKHANLTDSFITNLKKMVGWKNNCEAESLICIGRDDKNFQAIFNAETFIQKISILIEKDQQGLFDPAMVKDCLLEKIRGSQNENTA